MTIEPTCTEACKDVLIIEDNRDYAQLLADIMVIKGCCAQIAGTAAKGLELAEQKKFAVIFCDIGLPGEMNGLEFAQSLRANAALSETPLVAISGYSSDSDRDDALAAGFDLVFPKPFKFADLTNALQRFGAISP